MFTPSCPLVAVTALSFRKVADAAVGGYRPISKLLDRQPKKALARRDRRTRLLGRASWNISAGPVPIAASPCPTLTGRTTGAPSPAIWRNFPRARKMPHPAASGTASRCCGWRIMQIDGDIAGQAVTDAMLAERRK